MAVVGKTICPGKSCSAIAANINVFKEDGTYVTVSDRWDDEGRYAIVNNTVIVKLGEGLSRYAFYRSVEGVLLMAWEGSAGNIQSSTVFVK